jgi:glutathione synthase/RimK-type ligase-like ATP-grasp enzyme
MLDLPSIFNQPHHTKNTEVAIKERYLMNQKIWVVRDEYEPLEGPYWSGHVNILAQAARTLTLPICEICITNPKIQQMMSHELILFRPTENGQARRAFIKHVQTLRGHSINKKSTFVGSKQSFHQLAQELSIPTPQTWIGEDFLQEKPSLPHGFVVKRSKGAQGNGVFFCATRKQAIQKIRKENRPMIVQEFIPLPKLEDIRLLMVGETLSAAMKRVLNSDVQGEFRANLSLGTAHPIPYTPTDEVIQYAQRIMRHTGLDFAGIDVLIHNNTPFFLECNTRPGLKGIVQTDSNIATRTLTLLCAQAIQRSKS